MELCAVILLGWLLTAAIFASGSPQPGESARDRLDAVYERDAVIFTLCAVAASIAGLLLAPLATLLAIAGLAVLATLWLAARALVRRAGRLAKSWASLTHAEIGARLQRAGKITALAAVVPCLGALGALLGSTEARLGAVAGIATIWHVLRVRNPAT